MNVHCMDILVTGGEICCAEGVQNFLFIYQIDDFLIFQSEIEARRYVLTDWNTRRKINEITITNLNVKKPAVYFDITVHHALFYGTT